jgi:hypothetical protein
VQPGLREPKLAANGIRGNTGAFRDFFGGHPGEEAHFDQARFPLIGCRQTVQSLVQRDD